MRRRIAGMRTLVTGGSSGVGAALAATLDAAGAETLLTARRGDELAKVQTSLSDRASVWAADQTIPADRERLMATAKDRWGVLDAVVCCAGVGAVGPFRTASPQRLRSVFEINVLSTIELIQEALPLLERGRSPIVVVIGSVLGHRAVPTKAEYSAAKFALHGFCDAVRAEWRGRIDVTLVSPGTIASPFWDALVEGGGEPAGRLRRGAISPETVARATLAAMRSGRHEVILPWSAKTLVWLDRLMPTVADWAVSRFG